MAGDLGWDALTPHLHGIASLATVTPAGEPHVAIVTPLLVDDLLWIGANRSSAKTRNLASTPTVALVWATEVDAYVWGATRLIDDIDTKRRLWDRWAYDAAEHFVAPDDDDYVLVEVSPTRAMVIEYAADGVHRRRWRP